MGEKRKARCAGAFICFSFVLLVFLEVCLGSSRPQESISLVFFLGLWLFIFLFSKKKMDRKIEQPSQGRRTGEIEEKTIGKDYVVCFPFPFSFFNLQFKLKRRKKQGKDRKTEDVIS